MSNPPVSFVTKENRKNAHVCLDVTHNHIWICFYKTVYRAVVQNLVIEVTTESGPPKLLTTQEMFSHSFTSGEMLMGQLYHGVFNPNEHDIELVDCITKKHPTLLVGALDYFNPNIYHRWFMPTKYILTSNLVANDD